MDIFILRTSRLFAKGERWNKLLGGDRSILLSYGNITYFILDRPFYISKTRVPNRVPNPDLMATAVCISHKKPHSTGFFRCLPWHLEDIAFRLGGERSILLSYKRIQSIDDKLMIKQTANSKGH